MANRRVQRRRRLAGVAAVSAAIAAVVVVTTRASGTEHQSAEEIGELASLPEELTPLDAANPNPTGDDPLAIGEPPDIEGSPVEDFLGRAEQRRAGAPDAPPVKPREDGPPVEAQADPDSLLVSFAPGTSDDDIAAALEAAGVSGTPIEGIGVVEVDTAGQDQAAVAAALEGAAGVEAVEPNLVRRAAATPDDPELPTQAAVLGRVGLPTAWDVADTGASVVVAVLDTGVDLDHPDLAPNLVAGRDTVNEDGDPMDDNGHGTAVAGIVGAVTDNGVGVAGVAWNAKIMPVKVLGADGLGTDADVAQGIVWATDHGARIINLSLGGPGASAVLDNAVGYALQHEVVVVAAAGNAASQVPSYPAATPGVLGVTATDAAGQFAWFSNHGPFYLLAAPGMDVRTTALTAGPAGGYTSGTGTSFSSPIVAGVAALVRERHPGWGWFEAADELVRTARDAGPAGVDDAYGFGIVDAAAALGVGPLGAVSQVPLDGDAGNLRSTARTVAVGQPVQEAHAYEYDEDWFAFDVPAAAGATITVDPSDFTPTSASEMDPVLELYGPGGGLVARVDTTFEGETEVLTADLGPGRHTLRVRNYLGARGGPYLVQITLGDPLPPTAWAPREDVFAVQAWEEAVAVADFTGDGRDDVAMAAGYNADPENDYKLLVFTQAEDGTLSAAVRLTSHATYPSHGDPLQAADLDGDGDIDLAWGTASGLDVAWNDGTGLTAPVLYAATGSVRRMQAADLDGTAPLEILAQGGGPLQVLRWSAGDDNFTVEPLAISVPVTNTGIGFDIGDLTGDGRPDISTFAGSGLAVHAQQPDGSWAAPTTIDLPGYDASASSQNLATGDVTGDGRADLVVVGSWGQSGPRLAYLAQQAGGGLGPVVTLPAATSPGAVKIADVTDDGRDDVAVLYNGGNVGVFDQTPAGTLDEGELLTGPYATWHESPDSLALGDVDSDGVNDLATAGYNFGLSLFTHQVAVAAEGAGPWLEATTPAEHATGVATSVRPAVTFGRDVAAASVNADTVFLLDGRDGHTVPTTLSRSGRTVTLTPARALQRGVPYQVWVAGVTDPTGTEFAFEQVPFTTAPGAAPSYSVTRTLVPFRIDLDGNGYDDIFWYAPGTEADSIWFFGTEGRTGVRADVRGTYTPIPGDFDGNGYEDIFWYGPGSGTDVMWANGRDGITASVMPVSGVYVPIAGDFDRNGYDDVFWYGPGTAPDSMWLFGPTGRTSVGQRVTGTSYRPAAGDFTRDGYDDIVWYAPGTAGESLWRGSAAGFRKGGTMSITGTYRTRPLDFNADGFDEVFLYTTDRGVFWRSGPSGFVSVQAGPSVPSGVRPVAGDFTGDLRDDLFAYVPGTTADRFYRGGPTGVG